MYFLSLLESLREKHNCILTLIFGSVGVGRKSFVRQDILGVGIC